MFTSLENGNKNNQQISWEQRLLKNAGRQKTSLKPEYQELKFTLHRKLLDKINLEALATIDNQRVRAEVRQAVISADRRGADAAQLARKAADHRRGSGRSLRPGPARAAAAGPHHLGHPGEHATSWSTSSASGMLELTNVDFNDDAHLLRIIDKIVSQVGRRVDESSPLVDARLPDGSRVNADHPAAGGGWPAALHPPFRPDKLMPTIWWSARRMTQGMMELLKRAVKARLNILIAGGTGSGKTTLLNALSCFIPEDERIVTIEDAAELQLKQTHVARMETRPANVEGTGAIRQRELLVNSLRMRPDRIIVGEVRGEEALDMLQAMNTGHDGSLTTVHANTPRDAV